MMQKKSMTAAIEEARQMSAKNPRLTYWVMDKPREKTVCTCVEWICRERILAGWTIHSAYRNGKEVRKEETL